MAGTLARRAAWLASAKALAFALGFALPLILVRTLSQTEFGIYKQVFLLLNTGMTILPLGFAMSAFYFLPRCERGRASSRLVFNIAIFHLAVGGAAALALVAFPGALAAIFASHELVGYAPALALLGFLAIGTSFLEIIAVANGEVALAARLIVLTNLVKTILLLGAAWLAPTIEALIAAATINCLGQAALLFWYLDSRFPRFWAAGDWRMMRAQLGYALPLGAAAMLSMAQLDLHSYFVARSFDAATFAIYAVGCFQLPFLYIVNESVGAVMIPAVGRLQREGQPSEIVGLIASMMRKLGAMYFPLYAGLIVTGREFITVLFTDSYRASWPIFAVNLTLIPLCMLTAACDPVLRAYPSYTAVLVRIRVVLIAVLALGLWAVTARHWLLGAILVMVGVNLIDRIVVSTMLARMLEMRWRDLALFRDVAKLALAATVAALAAEGMRALLSGAAPLVVLAAAGATVAVVYVPMVWILGVPTPAELAALRRRAVGAGLGFALPSAQARVER
ncbi:MAG TPA: oligosaccharide flippase family protein [Candidatus Polarisedimenticolaceae bacterium]|nr:oligosaccharide flippase family protein [Candidatus Polarisedimenticolaceae bacterium]